MQDADVTPIHKKDDKTDKVNYRPISILPKLKSIRDWCTTKSFHVLIQCFPNLSVDFGKVLMRNIASVVENGVKPLIKVAKQCTPNRALLTA